MKSFLLFFSVFAVSLVAAAQPAREVITISDDISLIKLSDKAYVHVSVADMGRFGKVSSNGMVLVDGGEAFLIDTPVDDAQTKRLVDGIADKLRAKVTTFVATHWHDDCMGGLSYLQSTGVESYALDQTIAIAREKNLPLPQHGFATSLTLTLRGMNIECEYLGAGHALDNIVVWLPSDKILFGGCLLKEITATSRGNLSDADIKAWPITLDKLARQYPEAKIVIPGHGEIGDTELIRHTRQLVSD